MPGFGRIEQKEYLFISKLITILMRYTLYISIEQKIKFNFRGTENSIKFKIIYNLVYFYI